MLYVPVISLYSPCLRPRSTPYAFVSVIKTLKPKAKAHCLNTQADNWIEGIAGTIHECGHAMYEQVQRDVYASSQTIPYKRDLNAPKETCTLHAV